MRYDYREGATKTKKAGTKILLSFAFVVVMGGYLGISALAPSIPAFATGATDVASLLKTSKPEGGNKLYIPRLNVVLPVATGDTAEALSRGAWHRTPRSGDPKSGGNFVLSAYKYTFAMNPAKTRDLSPFYHLGTMQPGDEVYVDYNGTRYAYKVAHKSESTDEVEKLEQRVNIDRLTLYAASRDGERADTVVVDAEPIGVVAWNATGPVIKKLN